MQPTTKYCPFCAEEIRYEAVKCKHCGEWLGPPADAAGGHAPAGPYPYRPAPTPLTRSVADRTLAGVCGGLARWAGMDPTLVRVLYAVGSFFTAFVPGILLYVILALVIPSEGDPRATA